MEFVELFAGVGGFHLGITQALQGGVCVYANEWDRYAAQTYNKNFKEHHVDTTDITKVKTLAVPRHDCLVGGFPCQAFSIAGKRQGFKETRGTLFFEIARLLAHHRPRHLVLENVKGLLTHDTGKTFAVIIGVLTDLGYRVEWQVLNSRNFGVPQNRERIFIIGHLRDQCAEQILPITYNDQDLVKNGGKLFRSIQTQRDEPNSGHPDGEIPQNGPNGHLHQLNNPKHSTNRVFAASGASPSLTTMQGGNRQPKILQKSQDWREDGTLREFTDHSPTLRANMGDNQPMLAVPVLTPDRAEKRQNGRRFKEDGDPMFTLNTQDRHGVLVRENTKAGFTEAKDGDSISLRHPSSKTRRGRVGKGVANTLDTGEPQAVLKDMAIRRLTPVECERLQGFPDDWTKGVSDTQRYKQMGNAVTVNVIKAIFERLNAVCKLNK